MTENVACPNCGAATSAAVRAREVAVGRWSTIVDAECQACSSCGEEFLMPRQLQATLEIAARIIREKKGLVSPDRIRSLRGRYGLTQEQLERLLGVSPKMVVRWERGTVVPTLAASRLMEVLETVPEAVLSLATRHGVVVRQIRSMPSWPVWERGPEIVPIPARPDSSFNVGPDDPMEAVA